MRDELYLGSENSTLYFIHIAKSIHDRLEASTVSFSNYNNLTKDIFCVQGKKIVRKTSQNQHLFKHIPTALHFSLLIKMHANCVTVKNVSFQSGLHITALLKLMLP